MDETITIIFKLLLAAILGGAIGFERERHGQAAGFRTNIIVALAACLMMILSLYIEELYKNFDSSSTIRIDPARIASYAIASMGFLGAGAIIKGQGSIKGLTTAAGLWLVTAIGLSIGAGLFFPAIAVTIFSLIILYIMRLFIRPSFTRDTDFILSITYRNDLKNLKNISENIEEIIKKYKGHISHIDLSYKLPYSCILTFHFSATDTIEMGQIIEEILSTTGYTIEKIEWKKAPVF